jgi:hypothetical protein
LLVAADLLVPPVALLGLLLARVPLLGVEQVHDFGVREAGGGSELDEGEDFVAHEGDEEGLAAVEAGVLVGDERVGHGAPCAGGQDGVLVAEGLGPNSQRAQLHLFRPLVVDDQVRQLVVAGPCCLVPFQPRRHLRQRVVDVRRVNLRQLVLADLSDQEPAGVEDGVERSIRTCEEGSLYELGHRVVHEVDLGNIPQLLILLQL